MIRAIFGGTFDPIHNGHLQTAVALVKELGISTLALMPSAVPPHRPQPDASPEQRLDMVKLASQQHTAFTVEDWELRQNRPSFTANTLSEFKTQFPDDTLLFVMGMDSLMSLHRWHQWHQLLEYAHLVVMPRAGVPFNPQDDELKEFISTHLTRDKNTLHEQRQGLLYIAETPMVDVAATELREQLKHRENNLPLPSNVYDYIRQHQLYL
ncbi:nicotinate-nucleotide adenylyltransferase [Idiomarina sp. M1R2S28]|uniref:Probable nicotinate-nucleotide adenylyltransferase n=1 Tax=Idiomarina rhizosphaerae TaxID=2961572 RepID=A0A9X2FXJ4_9GAMM|nr:nicotinate-nucleotide adenylyltransferase [Idiomarina rhizosphaerae]MCP1339755.1 nicotinate-nucleotide adenylyltransferase [Idiomarina rhizosphaerae]